MILQGHKAMGLHGKTVFLYRVQRPPEPDISKSAVVRGWVIAGSHTSLNTILQKIGKQWMTCFSLNVEFMMYILYLLNSRCVHTLRRVVHLKLACLSNSIFYITSRQVLLNKNSYFVFHLLCFCWYRRANCDRGQPQNQRKAKDRR